MLMRQTIGGSMRYVYQPRCGSLVRIQPSVNAEIAQLDRAAAE